VSAVAARDLARNGHRVTIFIPVLPYHFYMATLNKAWLRWLRSVVPHIKDWLLSRKFPFQDLLDEDGVRERVSVRFVPRRASGRQLQGLDYLIVHSIAQVSEYQDRFPQNRQIYLVHHPEERYHQHADTFRAIRRAFAGKLLVISPFTAGEIGDHVSDPPVVTDPISPLVWDQRSTFDPALPRKDILLFWKDRADGLEGAGIVKKLMEIRPSTSLTIWCRGHVFAAMARKLFPEADVVENLTEQALCGLYLGHSFLVFPSRYEGFGMPPVEALACGCIPVLHPHVGAAQLYARDGVNSVFLGDEPAGVARRISDILDDSASIQSMRTAGPQSILPFDPEGYGHRLLEAAGILPSQDALDLAPDVQTLPTGSTQIRDGSRV
jgi:glycosyltransferase involved in cell wall biosynthesis